MKILNINSYYYSSTVHKNFDGSLHARGINTSTYVPLAKGYEPRTECRYGEERHVIVSNCYNKIDRYVFSLKHKKILRNITSRINIEDYDFLHAHSLFSNGYIALQVKEQYGIPYVVSVRGTDLNTFFKYMVHLRPIGLKILEHAEKVIFLSEACRASLFEKYLPTNSSNSIYLKTKVIPNGIDSFWFKEIGKTKKLQGVKKIRLVFVGTISKRKNLITTIRAINILIKQGYKVTYTVVGRVQDEKIYNKIKKIPFVNYIEPVEKGQLLNIYRDNDIFIMPSVRETFGLVYAEAMSQGLPVIYTRGQGFDRQFNEGVVGYSVDCFDTAEIANRVHRIMEDYTYLSNNAIKLCDKFNWENIIGEYEKIYNDMLFVNANKSIGMDHG